jgi:hypothetical protein
MSAIRSQSRRSYRHRKTSGPDPEQTLTGLFEAPNSPTLRAANHRLPQPRRTVPRDGIRMAEQDLIQLGGQPNQEGG